jgi:hypothetical protein
MRSTRLFKLAVTLSSLALGACYHVVINTGKTEGATKIEKPFASSFIFGLVPVPEIDASTKCTSGVAKIDYQQDFLNGLVGIITLGIYTPLHVTVTCAASGTGALPQGRVIDIGSGSDHDARVRALSAAAERTVATGQSVFVRY